MEIQFEFFRVLPVLLFFIAACYALTYRSLGWTIMVAGLILNGILWVVLTLFMSRYYPELSKRPNKSQCYFWYQEDISMDNGMPSGHCQSTAFFSTWLILMALYYRVDPWILVLTIGLSTFMIVGMIYSRVKHYRCHTFPQALAGTSVGVVTACILKIFYLN